MGKEANAGGAAAAAGAVAWAGDDGAVMLKNYSVVCKRLGIKGDEDVLEALTCEDKPTQVSVDAELGAQGVQALVTALVGAEEGLGGSYNLLTTLRLWRSNLGDEGAEHVAAYLALGVDKEEQRGSFLDFVQMLDCGVGKLGCRKLGQALALGANRTLLALNLDHNSGLGAAGLRELTNGLCTNSTLRRLSLAYCGIEAAGGRSVKNLMQGLGTQLEEIVLKGNPLGGAGLAALCGGGVLAKNKVLRSLDLSDTDVGPDVEALLALAEAMRVNRTLVELKFDENHIEEAGASALVESGVFEKKGANSTLKLFTVDFKIPSAMFESLLRSGGAGAGKKKGGKKKKKK